MHVYVRAGGRRRLSARGQETGLTPEENPRSRGEAVGRPGRRVRHLNLAALDPRDERERSLDVFCDRSVHRASRCGERHQNVHDAFVEYGDVVDETEIDDIDTQLGIDDVPQRLLDLSVQRFHVRQRLAFMPRKRRSDARIRYFGLLVARREEIPKDGTESHHPVSKELLHVFRIRASSSTETDLSRFSCRASFVPSKYDEPGSFLAGLRQW